ncbi:amidohydrolase [Macrococcoides caseolyticum]|uniref:amidohydrolase n=1 Tax=Macrococcoides caseolyticum TaxID=69966 RepID=UPI001F47AAD0|nr:amidohydrolase [Macrococcus caseolyticus]MCE4957883.1 amidohydrolase [Macrococcus caseolyticus]
MDIHQIIAHETEELINIRRYLHMHPELSFQEIHTYQFILEQLQQLEHFTIREHVGEKGIVATIQHNNGPSIAFRADFDALPIQDQKDVPYQSQNKGVMHACGHDGHTSILLGVARVLNQHYDAINGTVVLIFQFGEELAPGGAEPMTNDGALKGVDRVYGNHLWSPFEVGAVHSKYDALLASPDMFSITIQGKGGHGAHPDTAIDAIVAMATFITNLQTIVSRSVPPTSEAVLTIGKVVAGNAFNIISDSAFCTGTVRTFDPEIKALIKRKIDNELIGLSISKGITYTLDYVDGYPAVINHNECVDVIRRAVQRSNLPYQEMRQVMIGEDFSYYLQHQPGAFFFTAAGNTDKGITAPHHHPLFDFDESAMNDALKVFLNILVEEGVL